MPAAAKPRTRKLIDGLRRAVKAAVTGPHIDPTAQPIVEPIEQIETAHVVVAAVLIDHELQGLFAEAFEAYDMQDERLRIDTANRRWTFTPEKLNSQSVLRLQLKRLEDVREDTISTAVLASDLGRPMIEDVVRKLDASL